MKLLAGGRPLAWTKGGGTFMRSIYLSLAISFSFIGLIPVGASAQGGLATRVAQLEAQVAALEEILRFVRVEFESINGLAGPHWIVEGANVHVRSGSGVTNDGCEPRVVGSCENLTGLGNLVVGYNEGFPSQADVRNGSHNLIVGSGHRYTSIGGLVAGRFNAILGRFSSVCGGISNEASGSLSSVCGGGSNVASGPISSVSGGASNEASGRESSVSGGVANNASGRRSSVSGGFDNEASGGSSSVSGGKRRTAPDGVNWAAGDLFEPN